MADRGSPSPRLILAAKGFCMGAADVVPGVSGGTMAFILGIYPRLIDAIRSFDGRWLMAIVRLDLRSVLSRPHFGFVLPLAAGIALALFFFTRVISIPALLETHPEQVYGLFFGLIAGSIAVLLKQMGRAAAGEWLLFGLGLAGGLLVFQTVPAETPDAAWFIFLCGLLSISAMLLPGVSGSFVLLLLKKYGTVFSAIGHLEFAILVPFAAGAIAGLAAFSRFLSWLLHGWYRKTVMAILGILVASLWVLWPFQQRSYAVIDGRRQWTGSTPVLPDALSAAVIQSLLLALAGVTIVVLLHRYASRLSTDT